MKYHRITLRKMEKSIRIPAYILNHYAMAMNKSIDSSKIDAREMIVVEFDRTRDLKSLNAHWLSEKILQKAEMKIQELRDVVYK